MRRNTVTARSTGSAWVLMIGSTPLLRLDTRTEAEACGKQLAAKLGIEFGDVQDL